jgi:hypothetical protein
MMAEIPKPLNTTDRAIYTVYESAPQWERSYLGASVLGGECERKLWYDFHWAYPPEAFSGRMLRLFQTGHREEARLIEDLRNAGVHVEEFDPSTGKQWAMTALGGHLKGHLDGVVTGLIEAPTQEHVLETKTHNDKSFKSLLKDGVKISKPVHYAQTQIYMNAMGLNKALYLAVNKNDDMLYVERIKLDELESRRLLKKAERIINAGNAPGKLSEDPSFFTCNWCPAKAVCHEGAPPRRNCRTCISSTPIVDDSDRAAWHCAHWDRELSSDDQKVGCREHLLLPSLVPGVQTDASEEERWIEYQMPDGSMWTDGERKNEIA